MTPQGKATDTRNVASDQDGPRITLGWAILACFALALVYFLPAFLPGRHIYGSDYLAAGYFFQEFLSERFAAGVLPKWVPYVYGGLPLFANPGSTYYPIRFLADLFFAPDRILPTIFVVQFLAAGVGMYLLTRELGVRPWVAFVAGLAFQFTGLMMSYVLAGHDGRVIVATLAPLLFYFLHRGIRTGALPAFAGAAATVGFGLLSFQIQSNYYLLLAGGLWALFCIFHLRVFQERSALVRRVVLGLVAVAFGFMLAAVNFLPFMDYVHASPRGGETGRGYEYSTSWSMPPAEITGLAVPENAGVLEHYRGENPFKLHTEYVGATVLLLLALGAYYARKDRRWWFFAGLAVFALTLSFGGHTPIYRLYYELLWGTNRFRAPSISFFLVSFSLVTMGALTLERLARLRAEGTRDGTGNESASGSGKGVGHGGNNGLEAGRWIAVGFAAFALLVLVLAGAANDGSPHGQAFVTGAFRFAVFAWLATGAVWVWLGGRLPTAAFAAILAVVTVVDLWIVDRRFFETVDSPNVMFAPDDVADFLRGQPDRFRVWVLPFPVGDRRPYRNHGDYLMHFDIDQAGGEHGNHIQRYGEFAGAGERTYVDWHNYTGDLERLIRAGGGQPGGVREAPFLAAANIRYIITPVRVSGLREAFAGRSGAVYEVADALPRAYLVPEVRVAADRDGALDIFREPGFDPGRTAVVEEPLDEPLPDAPLEGSAAVELYEPDRVVVTTDANRKAFLVLADNHYTGWVATVDDVAVPVRRANHTFRGVVVPAGRHRVEFRFEPRELYNGLYLYLGGLALLAGYGLWLLLRPYLGRGRAP